MHQAHTLANYTATLASLAGRSAQGQREALIGAAYLMAAAAIEGLLSETAHVYEPSLYNLTHKKNKKRYVFRDAGAPQKYKLLMKTDEAPVVLRRIWRVRVALMHSEPQHRRTGWKGAYMTVPAALRASEYVQSFAAAIALKFAHRP